MVKDVDVLAQAQGCIHEDYGCFSIESNLSFLPIKLFPGGNQVLVFFKLDPNEKSMRHRLFLCCGS